MDLDTCSHVQSDFTQPVIGAGHLDGGASSGALRSDEAFSEFGCGLHRLQSRCADDHRGGAIGFVESLRQN